MLGFGGFPGSGKTYSMIERASKWIGKREIYSNMGLPWTTDFEDLRELLLVTNALVLIDEAGIWFNSRKWNKLDEKVLAWFAMHRKAGCDIIWTAQRVLGVDSAIRGLTSQYAVCNRIGNIVLQKWHNGEDGKPMGKSITFLRPKVYDLYDTHQLVGFADGEGRGLGAAGELRTEAWLKDALEGALVRVGGEDVLGAGSWASYRPASLSDLMRGRQVLGRGTSGKLHLLEVPAWVNLEGYRHLVKLDLEEDEPEAMRQFSPA